MTIGIYRIFHVESGKSYVGQSINAERRISVHFKGLKSGKHTNEHLQRAYCLYGADTFKSEILQICSQESLTQQEQFWMDFYRQTVGLYNFTPAAGSVAGFKFSDESRQKLSKSLKGNRNGINSKGFLGKSHTEKSRELIAQKHKKPLFYNGIYYEGINDAAAAQGVHRSTIVRHVLSDKFKECYYA